MRHRFLVVAACLAVSAAPASSHAGEWILRARAISVSPSDSSDVVPGFDGTTVTVDGDLVPELDLTYMFDDTWGVEMIAATSSHDLSARDGALNGARAGSVNLLPPTFTLQYHAGYPAAVDFYAGVGINYTIFYGYDVSPDLTGAGVRDLEFDDGLGLAGQVGVDITAIDDWIINFDLKYIEISTDVTISSDDGTIADTFTVDVDPWIFGVGIGYRF